MDQKNTGDRIELHKEFMQSIYETKEYSDCEFLVGKNEVRMEGHKLMMSSLSPVFKAMFYGALPESDGPIRIPDIEPESFDGMLQFIYLNEVEFSGSRHAVQILQVAQKYIIPSLESVCRDFIVKSLNSYNVFDVFEFAALYNMDDIMEMCMKLARKDGKLLTGEKFAEADLNFVAALVRQKELTAVSERELFEAVERWAVKNAEKQGVPLGKFMLKLDGVVSQIRFRAMSVEDLRTSVVESAIISKEEKVSLIVNHVTDGLLPYPGRFSCCSEKRAGVKHQRKTSPSSSSSALSSDTDSEY